MGRKADPGVLDDLTVLRHGAAQFRVSFLKRQEVRPNEPNQAPRVTQGHSGRPLVMPAVAWFAFVVLQAVAIMRIVAELMPDAYAWHFAAAIGRLLALAPWVARLGWIYLSPRRDGKPG